MMNKKIILTLLSLALGATCVRAQGAVDLYQLSQTQLRGTARYLSMGGAFGALGGDISTLNQNPAGIGVYRSSEISATLDIDFQRSTLMGTGNGNGDFTNKQTRAACNNFGYIGSVNTGSYVMPYFQWGATYNRINSFERNYKGYFPSVGASWSEYVASISNGASVDPDGTVTFGDQLSALAYDAYVINDNPNFDASNPDSPRFVGLYQNGAQVDADVNVVERGYVDEYSINFGGNFVDKFYWGIGFGITDLSFTRQSYYNEQVVDAMVPNVRNGEQMTTGASDFYVDNYQHVSGTGFNVKFGLIFKPINELRIGLAVHTPTWYNLSFSNSPIVGNTLSYTVDSEGYYIFNYNDRALNFETSAADYEAYWTRKMRTPWRLMASAAGVIGGRFIVSADYVYEAYPSMRLSDSYGEFGDVTNDVKRYYSGASELRLGAEFRITPKFSVRAGYALRSTGATERVRNGQEYVYTTGTQTMYEFAGNRHNVSFGLGYRTGGFYIDAAYVHTTQTSEWNAFTPFPSADGDYALVSDALRGANGQVRDTNNRLVFTIGFKF